MNQRFEATQGSCAECTPQFQSISTSQQDRVARIYCYIIWCSSEMGEISQNKPVGSFLPFIVDDLFPVSPLPSESVRYNSTPNSKAGANSNTLSHLQLGKHLWSDNHRRSRPSSCVEWSRKKSANNSLCFSSLLKRSSRFRMPLCRKVRNTSL